MEKHERLVLKYPVLVEGKYDRIKLSNVVASPILTADGFAVFNSPQKKKLLRRLTQAGKLILLTDSDSGGRLIRNKLKGYLPPGSTIDLYIPKLPGRERRKSKDSKEGLLGVEGMDDRLLYELLAGYAASVGRICRARGDRYRAAVRGRVPRRCGQRAAPPAAGGRAGAARRFKCEGAAAGCQSRRRRGRVREGEVEGKGAAWTFIVWKI